MARPLRIEYPGAFYHVMNRGTARSVIFPDPSEDRALFLKTLGEAAHLWKVRIHAYSLMDNHYHLLLETPYPNLSRAMRHLDGVFTQRLNRRLGRDGSLFRGRFKSILVERDSYFLELVRYIHLNGVRALQYPTPAADPHCSHASYLGIRKAPVWLDTDLALSFYGSDRAIGLKKFDAFVREGVSKELETKLSKKKWPAILGVQSFIEDIRRRFQLASPPHREKPQERALLLTQKKDPDEVLNKLGQIFKCYGLKIPDRSKKKQSLARQLAIYILRHACHLSYSEIGKKLGGIGDAAVLYNLKRMQPESVAVEIQHALKEELGIRITVF